MKKIIPVCVIIAALFCFMAFSVGATSVTVSDGWSVYDSYDLLNVYAPYQQGMPIVTKFEQAAGYSTSVGSGVGQEGFYFEVCPDYNDGTYDIVVPAGYTVVAECSFWATYCTSSTCDYAGSSMLGIKLLYDSGAIPGTVVLDTTSWTCTGTVEWKNTTGKDFVFKGFKVGFLNSSYTSYTSMYLGLTSFKYKMYSELDQPVTPSDPEGSETFKDLEDQENNLKDQAGVDDLSGTLDEFSTGSGLIFQGYAGEFQVISLLINNVLLRLPDLQGLLYISLTLGVFGVLTGLGISWLNRKEESAVNKQRTYLKNRGTYRHDKRWPGTKRGNRKGGVNHV